MRILFISSGLSNGTPSPIITAQANSVRKQGIQIDNYTLKKKGTIGYIKEMFKLRKYLKKNKYDLYHAHYGLSAIVSSVAHANPLVVSLMGSDVKDGGWQTILIKIFVKIRWTKTITKSNELANIIGAKFCNVIPNGVNFETFKPLDKNLTRKKLNLHKETKYILFGSNPDRPEKNFELAKQAINSLPINIKTIFLKEVNHENVPLWLNAVDIVILSSLWEGSPNIIKEAMACNKPVVSTNVGDIEWLFGNEKGYFISSFDTLDFAEKIKLALAFSCKNETTNGRNRLQELDLIDTSIAKRIVQLYKEVTNSTK